MGVYMVSFFFFIFRDPPFFLFSMFKYFFMTFLLDFIRHRADGAFCPFISCFLILYWASFGDCFWACSPIFFGTLYILLILHTWVRGSRVVSNEGRITL